MFVATTGPVRYVADMVMTSDGLSHQLDDSERAHEPRRRTDGSRTRSARVVPAFVHAASERHESRPRLAVDLLMCHVTALTHCQEGRGDCTDQGVTNQ